MPKTTRRVEMYVGYSNGSHAGNWATEYVEIPIATPEESVRPVACQAMQDLLEERQAQNAAFWGVYHIPDAEEPNCFDCLDLGFLHMTSDTRGREIQTCDSCQVLKTDAEAVAAHAKECKDCTFIETGDVPDQEGS